MKTKTIEIKGLKTLDKAAAQFLTEVNSFKNIAFYGPMGAGKTTFIRAICKQLGVEDVVTSPSFALINEYMDGEGNPVFHFDFYRLKSATEALDIGFEEYIESGCYCFMEWPAKIEELLPEDTLKVQIEVLDKNNRRISFNTQ
jgi:tRNA threonylcarbamoyladenosine biosynthesis protein TsaE